MIIDFHTHIFPDHISEGVLHKLGKVACCMPHTSGTLNSLRYSMEKNHIQYSITLPAVTNPGKVTKVNDAAIASLEENFQKGIISFGGIHPDFPDIQGECKRLKANGVKGIKLHPAYQKADITDPRMMKIIDCASNEGLIILTHAGIDIGLYDHNYCSVSQILTVIDTIHPEKLVLAHMGNWGAWDEVESDLVGANVYFDTAFSLGEITAYPDVEPTPYHKTFLSNHDFSRICKKHGFDRILFGTDSPWQDQGYCVNLIKELGFSEERENRIFYENACELLDIP